MPTAKIIAYTVSSSYGPCGSFTITGDFPRWEASMMATERARKLSVDPECRGITFFIYKIYDDDTEAIFGQFRNGVGENYDL